MEIKEFNIGDEVMFIDSPHGTSLSLNGRIGKITNDEYKFMEKDGDKWYGVEWTNKVYKSDSAFTVCKSTNLRLLDLTNPEQYALHIYYKCMMEEENRRYESDCNTISTT